MSAQVAHVMLDLETLGTSPGSAFVQVGMVIFYPDAHPPLERRGKDFLVNVCLTSALFAGLTIDPSTVQWWRNQPAPQQRRLYGGRPLDLAMAKVLEWWQERQLPKETPVWAQGTNFDVSLIDKGFHTVGLRAPWAYNSPRDTRTLYWTAERLGWKRLQRDPIWLAHSAVDDCHAQIDQVLSALDFISREK